MLFADPETSQSKNEIVTEREESELISTAELEEEEMSRPDGTHIRKRTTTTTTLRPVTEKSIQDGFIMETKSFNEVVSIEIEEETIELEPDVTDEYGSDVEMETEVQECTAVLHDGTPAKKTTKKTKVARRKSARQQLKHPETGNIRTNRILESDDLRDRNREPDVKIFGDDRRPDDTREPTQQDSTIEERNVIRVLNEAPTRFENNFHPHVSSKDQEFHSYDHEPTNSDLPPNLGQQITKEILEEDEVIYSNIEEEEGTLDNGTIMKRKVVTSTRIRPITELLLEDNNIIDSKTFEIVSGTDIEEEIVELPAGVHTEYETGLDCETHVRESKETLRDGTLANRRVTVRRYTWKEVEREQGQLRLSGVPSTSNADNDGAYVFENQEVCDTADKSHIVCVESEQCHAVCEDGKNCHKVCEGDVKGHEVSGDFEQSHDVFEDGKTCSKVFEDDEKNFEVGVDKEQCHKVSDDTGNCEELSENNEKYSEFSEDGGMNHELCEEVV